MRLSQSVVPTCIAGGLKIQGRGQHRFEVLDHHGRKQVIVGEGILLEELHCQLIPPQKIMADDDEGCFRINGKEQFVLQFCLQQTVWNWRFLVNFKLWG